MAIPVLNELRRELVRLSAAGSRLAPGDARLTGLLTPLGALAERSAAIRKLADLTGDLVASDPARAGESLLECMGFLESLLATQGETYTDDPAFEDNPLPPEDTGELWSMPVRSYRELQSLASMLSHPTGAKELEALEAALKSGELNDPRLFGLIASGVGHEYYEANAFMARAARMIGRGMTSALTGQLHLADGGAADSRRLAAISDIEGEDARGLLMEALKTGSQAVRETAVLQLGAYPGSEDALEECLTGQGADIRRAALSSLVRLGSSGTISALFAEAAASPEGRSAKARASRDAREIIRAGTSSALFGPCLEAAVQALGEAVSSPSQENISWLKETLIMLKGKKSPDIAAFLTSALESGVLEGLASDVKDKSDSLSALALSALFSTGFGDDSIWEMFRSATGFMAKVRARKLTGDLAVYAFKIGAQRLDPEEFYDVFFRKGAYNTAKAMDRFVFDEVFARGGQAPPLSRKVCAWFIDAKDYVRAWKALQPGDEEHEAFLRGRLGR